MKLLAQRLVEEIFAKLESEDKMSLLSKYSVMVIFVSMRVPGRQIGDEFEKSRKEKEV